MAKIPFTLEAWLKDKSQKVETRDGRIVHDIWEVKNAVTAKEYRTEVCALIEGEEDALVFFKNGKYLPVNAESPYDLFIVTPEPELTEFETALLGIINDAFDCSGYNNENAKIDAAKLLDLARKELIEEQFTSDPRKTDLYKLGKKEALKELPKWKKFDVRDPHNDSAFRVFADFDGDGYISTDLTDFGKWPTHYLDYKELRQLPKED